MRVYLRIAFLFLFFISPAQSSGQQSMQIKGIVNIQNDKKILSGVTVLLYAARDSSLVSTAFTNAKGEFSIMALNGTYYLVLSAIGYSKYTTATFQLKSNTNYQVPAIMLVPNSRTLKEVSVTASRSVLERKAGKLIFNIDAAPSTAGLNALEILRKAPGVVVDQNDNISLAGRTNVLVTIDGKQTYLSGSDVANLLKSMQSAQIESIEIISNPGARYEANSTGGIINIKTKKSKGDGLNGNLSLSEGYNKYLVSANSVDLNFRKKAFNIFGSYNDYRGTNVQHTLIRRVTPGIGNQLYFNQRSKDSANYTAQNFKIGTDFFIGKNHTIGFLMKGNIQNTDHNVYSNVNIGDSFLVADSVLKTTSFNASDNSNYAYNINYKGILDTSGQEISVDADYSNYDGQNNATYKNYFYLPDGNFLNNGQIYHNLAPSNIDIKAIKADYTLPLSRIFKLETGLKVASVKSDNNFVYENIADDKLVPDPARSNRFKYDEQVNAAYGMINIALAKTTIQGGIRIERTKSTGNSLTMSTITKKDYTDFFPSLTINRNFDADHMLNFSYSRKINRPNYQNLNPFLYYLDQYTYNQGNPNLKPEYATNLEAGFLYKQKYNAALAYSHVSDVISQALLQTEGEKYLYQTVLNLGKSDVLSLTLTLPLTLSKWWNISTSLLGYYKQIQSPHFINDESLNSKQLSGSFFAQNNFTLSRLFSADLGLFYSTPQIQGAYKIRSIFNADAGMRYSFPNKNGSLKLGMSDIFHSQIAKVYSVITSNDYFLQQYSTTTTVRLTFSYRFGKTTVKSADQENQGLMPSKEGWGERINPPGLCPQIV